MKRCKDCNNPIERRGIHNLMWHVSNGCGKFREVSGSALIMDCFTCNLRKIKERFGVYCSQECRNKELKKLERQKKQLEKRRFENEYKKFEEWVREI